ncbi:MAG: hypothetical protein FWD35_06675, partial [Oscillospiraceae bacterium]|nr:hypothetical protein [Oscillospiraceae bacterium]
MGNWINKIFGKKTTVVAFDAQPDYPQPFGYKTAWYAIKGETPHSVIEKLRLSVVGESNWEYGLNHVRQNDDVFVSPQVDGFVLVIDLFGNLHGADIKSAKKHSALFDEFCFFTSHRVSDYYAWAKFANGKLLRAYEHSGDEGLMTNEGEITAEELALKFDEFPITDEWDENDRLPEEDDVIDIAKAW